MKQAFDNRKIVIKSKGASYQDSYTKEQREQIKVFLAEQRYRDAENGTYKKGPHEIGFDADGHMMTEAGGLPTIPEEIVPSLGPVVEAFYNYYVNDILNPPAMLGRTE